MIPPRFDWLAPNYAWIEAITFGGLLQWCRTALLSELTDARRVLVLGEGDGRFAAAFLAANSHAVVDVVEASPKMAELAWQGIARIPGAVERVRWQIVDARLFEPRTSSYDLIVTNFFLDCFPSDELEPLIARLALGLELGGRWLVGDFSLPTGRIWRLLACAALAGMYAFFKLVTNIPAFWLADPQPFLRAQGLTLEREERRLGGFLTASLWRSSLPSTPKAANPRDIIASR